MSEASDTGNAGGAAAVLTDEVRARRVAVARDMIEQIQAKRMRLADHYGYLGANLCGFERQAAREKVIAIVKKGGDIQPIVEEIMPFCLVCFRGGLMLSKAKVFDAVPAALLFNEAGYSIVNQGTTGITLADTFDQDTLMRMEVAFERDANLRFGQMTDATDLDAVRGAAVFGRQFYDAEERALAVAQNLIDNDGEFIVAGVAEEDYDGGHGDDEDEDEDDDDDDDDDEDDDDEDSD